MEGVNPPLSLSTMKAKEDCSETERVFPRLSGRDALKKRSIRAILPEFDSANNQSFLEITGYVEMLKIGL
jgi:hypothetical protein